VIARIVNKKNNNANLTQDKVTDRIDRICQNNYDNIINAISNEIYQQKRDLPGRCNELARNELKTDWASARGRLSRTSGRLILSELSRWTTEEFKVPFGIDDIIEEIHADEIPLEMSTLLKEIVR